MAGPRGADTKRKQALAMVRRLNKAMRGDMMRWCSIDVIVQRLADVDVFAFAVEQGWIEASPGVHSVRLTAEGCRAVNDKGR
jgi:hypothetical protein